MAFYIKMIITEFLLGLIAVSIGRATKGSETNGWYALAGALYLSIPLTFLIMLWRVL